MSGLLRSVKGLVGSFVSLIREDGQSEECELVAAAGGGAPAFGVINMGSIESLTFPTSTQASLQPPTIAGTLTYAGSASMSRDTDKLVFSEPGAYLVTCALQVRVSSQVGSFGYFGAVDFNGDLVGLGYTDASPLGGQQVTFNLAGSPATQTADVVFTLVRRVVVTAPGQYVRALFGISQVSGDDKPVWGFSLGALAVEDA